jgi:hypothetical protein
MQYLLPEAGSLQPAPATALAAARDYISSMMDAWCVE